MGWFDAAELQALEGTYEELYASYDANGVSSLGYKPNEHPYIFSYATCRLDDLPQLRASRRLTVWVHPKNVAGGNAPVYRLESDAGVIYSFDEFHSRQIRAGIAAMVVGGLFTVFMTVATFRRSWWRH